MTMKTQLDKIFCRQQLQTLKKKIQRVVAGERIEAGRFYGVHDWKQELYRELSDMLVFVYLFVFSLGKVQVLGALVEKITVFLARETSKFRLGKTGTVEGDIFPNKKEPKKEYLIHVCPHLRVIYVPRMVEVGSKNLSLKVFI